MDYQALSMLVPKAVESWTITEIRKWLHFIHMQNLLHLFEKHNFNGEVLSKTNTKTLAQIGISSNIMQKKLMVWIEKGFVQFNQYLKNINYDKENICPNLNPPKTSSKATQKNNNKNQQPLIREEPVDNRLRITNFEGPQTIYYIAERKGLKIGRALTNQIQSLQVTVQNQHSQILMQQDDFYLVDLGTKSGTFIKIHYKLELVPGMLIQIGSYLLKVRELSNTQKKISFGCVNLASNVLQELSIDLSTKPNFSMGRRNNNDFYRDDQHLSGTHAKIYFLNGKFILEDMGSTNGTWLRLSEFKSKSQPYKLEDGSIFKIGNTVTYICHRQNSLRRESSMQVEQKSHICVNCNQTQRNMLYLPCKHTISCQSCCIEHWQCQICGHEIEEKVKIFI